MWEYNRMGPFFQASLEWDLLKVRFESNELHYLTAISFIRSKNELVSWLSLIS